jgi:hypothetical protein
MTFAWIAIGVVGAVLLLALVQIADLRKRVDGIPTGDDDLIGMLRRLDNEVGYADARLGSVEQRIAALEGVFPQALRRSAVVAYDAYPGMVGSLSRSVAMLDDGGDGFVLSVLVNREESRFFLKRVEQAAGLEPLSPEELTAISDAMQG